MTTARTPAVAYVRVSTVEQAVAGLSLDAQVAAVRAYAEQRGLDLVDVVVDAGVSAGKPLADRPGGAVVLDLVRRRRVRAVVAVKLDRLFRDAGDCLVETAAWNKARVALHLLDLAIDTSTTAGRCMLTQFAAFAEMERGLIRDRTRAALAFKRAQGRRTSKDAPYGFRVGDDGDTLVADDHEQRVLGLVRELRAAGVSIRGIVAQLTADGVAPRGDRWHKTTVERILRAAA